MDDNEINFTCSTCQMELLMHQTRIISKTLLKLNDDVKSKTEKFNLMKFYSILAKVNFNCKKIRDVHFFLHDDINCNPSKENVRENDVVSPVSEGIKLSGLPIDESFDDIVNRSRSSGLIDVFDVEKKNINDEKLITNFRDFKNLSTLTEEEHAIALIVQKEYDRKNIPENDSDKMEEDIQENTYPFEESDRNMECPICLDIPEKAPVFKCVNGHIICNKCRPSLTTEKCPICNVELGEERCFVTELYISNRPKKCRYERYGCKISRLNLDGLSAHEERCPKAPTEIEIRKEKDQNDQLIQKRKDIELALEIDELIQDDIKAQEFQDEGLAMAIQKTQEDELKRISIEEEDHQLSLKMEQDILQEQEALEKQRREQETSDFEYAQKLQNEMDQGR